jgi:hypothetical protein
MVDKQLLSYSSKWDERVGEITILDGHCNSPFYFDG